MRRNTMRNDSRLRYFLIVCLSIFMLQSVLSSTSFARSIGGEMTVEATQLLGTPFTLGGTSPQTGFDSSGFIYYLHQSQGITIPRKMSSQALEGMTIAKDKLLPGDIIFFKDSAGKPIIASIYIGNSQVIASTPSTNGVAYRSLTTTWAKQYYLTAKRYYPETTTTNTSLLDNSETTSTNTTSLTNPETTSISESNSTTNSKVTILLSLARTLLGTNYVFGGESLAGFDTSGLIYYILRENGVSIPRTVKEQWLVGEEIQQASLQPGDLVYFDIKRTFQTPSHVGLYVGEGKVILTASQLGKVTEKTLAGLQSYYFGAKRIQEIQGTLPSNTLPTTPNSVTTVADQIILTGEKYLGTPYLFGAKAGSGYFDCSLFTQTVFAENGITLPRSSRQQAQVGSFVKWGEWQKGDLLFFWTRATGEGNIGHVAIYAGEGKIIHTWGTPGVAYSNIEDYAWKNTYMSAKRVLQ